MRKFLALLFALLLCTATKVYAEDTATVTVTVKDLPQKLQNRTVIVTLGNGPSDTESTVIVLDGLNNYTATVTVAPSEYYCAAAVPVLMPWRIIPCRKSTKRHFCKQKAGTTTT